MAVWEFMVVCGVVRQRWKVIGEVRGRLRYASLLMSKVIPSRVFRLLEVVLAIFYLFSCLSLGSTGLFTPG